MFKQFFAIAFLVLALLPNRSFANFLEPKVGDVAVFSVIEEGKKHQERIEALSINPDLSYNILETITKESGEVKIETVVMSRFIPDHEMDLLMRFCDEPVTEMIGSTEFHGCVLHYAGGTESTTWTNEVPFGILSEKYSNSEVQLISFVRGAPTP